MNVRATAPRLVTETVAARDSDSLTARAPAPRGGAVGDLLVLVLLLVVSVVPILGLAAGGRWGARMVGVATAIALLAGRELVRELRACRAR